MRKRQNDDAAICWKCRQGCAADDLIQREKISVPEQLHFCRALLEIREVYPFFDGTATFRAVPPDAPKVNMFFRVVEAFRFMRFRTCLGYLGYPVLAVLLCAPSAAGAQDASSQQSAGSSSSQAGQTQPPQDQSQVLREAQERVNARRKVRIQQVIADTYSHKYELYFGGAYLHFTPGAHLQHVSEPGWRIDAAEYLNAMHGNLGIAADARGYYGTAYTGTNQYSVYNPGISEYTFMAGPRYRFFRGQHWGWTAEVLAGVMHANLGTGTNGLPPQYVGLYTTSNAIAVTPGASVDYNLSPTLAIRWSVNDIVVNLGGLKEDRAGGMGIVYRFGKK
jgi:hypothetical protein